MIIINGLEFNLLIFDEKSSEYVTKLVKIYDTGIKPYGQDCGMNINGMRVSIAFNNPARIYTHMIKRMKEDDYKDYCKDMPEAILSYELSLKRKDIIDNLLKLIKD